MIILLLSCYHVYLICCHNLLSLILIRDDAHMASMKIVQFLRPPTPLSIYVQNSSTLLTLDVQFQRSPSPLQVITNQLKENLIQDGYYMLSDPSFRSDFVFSINSLILSGFAQLENVNKL